MFPFRRRAMTVTRGMLGEPALRGGVLAGLGRLASVFAFSLGRNRVKKRHPDELIRRCRYRVGDDRPNQPNDMTANNPVRVRLGFNREAERGCTSWVRGEAREQGSGRCGG